MPPAIKVENLSKSYLVGHNNAKAESYTALRDVLSRNARNLVRKTRDMLTGRQVVQGDEVEEFWALKDINFEIQPGDRVGIIGRNGAGKSTLLKILSRITEPTTGRVTLKGRVASLLEVGTGFHPELTGRENIFLNGAILGMGRKEIQRKFDEIVDFAEVEKFLDTPVKRYSSGMYVRLAFAVAAHLEPEILVVDEVLAVGDYQFQSKCLGKMQEVGDDGRTVLFVSHNMGAINKLCEKAILLRKGELVGFGNAGEMVEQYMQVLDVKYKYEADASKINGKAGYVALEVIGSQGKQAMDINEKIAILLQFEVIQALPELEVSFSIFDKNNTKVTYSCLSAAQGRRLVQVSSGRYEYKVTIPARFFAPGIYSFSFGLHQPNIELFQRLENVITLQVDDVAGIYSEYHGHDLGVVMSAFSWCSADQG